MTQPALYRLGKKRPVFDRRTLRLSSYLKALPAAPSALDLAPFVKAPWGMMANDRLGDCTCAAAGHLDMIWSAQAGAPVTFTDDQIVEFYNRVNGGSDDGAVELFVLKEWRTNGGPAGRKIHAFVQISNLGDHELVKSAAFLFGGLYLGVALPVTAQGQAVWDVAGDPQAPAAQPGSWGGHAVPIIGYDATGVTVLTWGAPMRMTWAFHDHYTEEAYAVLPEEYVADPAVFDAAALEADLGQIGQVNPV